jgi:hypothetical protein
MLVNWAEDHDMRLIFDAKERGSFKSAAWNRETNPDLCFASSERGRSIPCTRRILSDFPRSQNRPVLIETGTKIPLITSYPRPRWNLQKANWKAFSQDLDKCLGWIPPNKSNYERYVGAVISTAKKHIPRGFRRQYVPGWNEKSEELYAEYLRSGEQEIADDLLNSLDVSRHQKWIQTVESMDFKTSSRNAWSLLRKLGGSNFQNIYESMVTPKKVAAHIASTSRVPSEKKHTKYIKQQLKLIKNSLEHIPTAITTQEISKAIKEMKPGKAPGLDRIHSEFLINCGKYTIKWLSMFLTDILQTSNIPDKLKRAKIIALLKPGKPPELVNNYRLKHI